MNKWFMLLLCAGLLCSAPADAQRKKKMKKVEKKKEMVAAPKPKPKPAVDRKGLFNVTKDKYGMLIYENPSTLQRLHINAAVLVQKRCTVYFPS